MTTDDDVLSARGLLFDMDGTLVDSTAVVIATWSEFADEHGLDVAEILAVSHGRKAQDTIVRFGPAGIDVEAVTRRLVEREIAQLDGVVEVPGAAAFLRSLPADRVALVTSAPRALAEARMRAIGLELPEVVIAAEDVVDGKPHPEPYERAAALLGLDPADALVFEDADAGLASAAAAGMRAVVIGDLDGPSTAALPRIRDYSGVGVEFGAAVDGGITLRIPR